MYKNRRILTTCVMYVFVLLIDNHRPRVKSNYIVHFMVILFSHNFIFLSQMLDLMNVSKIHNVRQSCMMK